MIEVFHGSLSIINEPKILLPTHTLDYGAGFYTTTSSEQAERWEKRKLTENGSVGYINRYAVDIDGLRNNCKVLWFDGANNEWLNFVMKNRTSRNFEHDFDLVYGPVANDRVYVAFSLYESGVFGKEDLIREVKTYKLVDQLLFHTDSALLHIKYLDCEEVRI